MEMNTPLKEEQPHKIEKILLTDIGPIDYFHRVKKHLINREYGLSYINHPEGEWIRAVITELQGITNKVDHFSKNADVQMAQIKYNIIEKTKNKPPILKQGNIVKTKDNPNLLWEVGQVYTGNNKTPQYQLYSIELNPKTIVAFAEQLIFMFNGNEE